MSWDFSTDPEFADQLDWMRTFVREEIMPLEVLSLSHQEFLAIVRPLQEQVKQRGLWAAHLAPELGGHGFGQLKLGLMHEILGQTPHGPVVFGNNAPDSGNAELLALGLQRRPQPEMRERWLEPLLNGTAYSAFSMTEPGAGSDPSLLATTAVRHHDEWVIDGHKWFTSNGSVADFLLVVCATAPDAGPRSAYSIIVVPVNTPGVSVLRDIPTMENPAPIFGEIGGHSEIRYEDVRVPFENLVGNEGDGMSLAQARLGPGRIHHCMRWLGQAQRAFDMMCERALSRYTHGSLLAEKQTIQNWIADSRAEITAARLMTLHAAWKIDQVGTAQAREEISLIKFFGAKVLNDVIDRAIQVHGSLGFSTDLPLEHMYRAARAARIYDGPDEVHRPTVARSVLKNYQPVAIPTEHVPTRRLAAEQKYAAFLQSSGPVKPAQSEWRPI
jgi:acyl-CoA dehydrogenase